SSSLPTWICDQETLAFLEVNQAAVKKYGYTREQFLTMTIRDIRPPEDVQAMEADVAKMPVKMPNATEWRHMKKDGTIIETEIIWQELIFRGRRALLVLANDI